MEDTRRYRALFISDVHLGSRAAKADHLIDFLRCHDAETIYLVGDIVDGWRLRRNWHWPQSHNDVAQKLLRKARKGARIFYIAGNHDEFLRDFQGTHFGGIEVCDRAVHEAADGRRYLVMHGDQFDAVIRNARWLAFLGDVAYDVAIVVNRVVSRARRLFGLPYWSFSAWAKIRVKKAVNFISQFENLLAEEAKREGAHGVVCGHIHHPAMSRIGEIEYINAGDWVEHCTAVGEHRDGRMEIIAWTNPAGLAAPLPMDLTPAQAEAA